MSIIIQGYQLRELLLGSGGPVETNPATPPTAGATPIFTVSGGRVVVTSLVVTAVTALSGGTNLAIVSAPTAGVAQNLAASGAFPTSLGTIGGMASVAGQAGAAMLAGGFTLGDAGLVIPAGTINVATTGTAWTGTLKYDLTYVPYDTGAFVSAAF